MKKLLTLVLCWLIAFSAMAETTLKAKTALSASGGFITSQNKVDGSFEDGISSWVASVGTIVKTASTEIQGNNIGVWSGTGTGTLDLQWTATASNTFDGNAFVNVGGEDDVYVCAYVGTTETGCKLIPALDKIQKVSVIADSIISSAFYLRLKHTGSDAFSIKVDDGKIEPQAFQNVQVVEQESVRYSGANLITTTGVLRFNNTGFNKLPSNLFSYDSATGFFTPKKKIVFSGGASLGITSNAALFYLRKASDGSVIAVSSNTPPSPGYFATLPFSIELNAGESIYFDTSATMVNHVSDRITITATAISDNVITSYQDGTEWTSYTPTLTGFGTPTSVDFKWKRDGSDVLIMGRFAAGTSTAVEAQATLPNGLLSSSTIYNISYAGDFALNFNASSSAKVLIEPSKTYMTFGYQGSANASLTKVNGNVLFGSGQGGAFVARIPIQGWSSAPTLLALPTSKENTFSACTDVSGNIISKNVDWIQSITRSGTGNNIYSIVFKPGLFSIAPAMTAMVNDASGSSSVYVSSASSLITATGATLTVCADTGAIPSTPHGICFTAQKQGSDYTAPGVFVGSLAKDYTAYVDSTETITNATDNFITSCTNADPTVCSFSANRFGSAPYCNAQKTSSADIYVTTTSLTSVTIERADASSPFSLFCQIK